MKISLNTHFLNLGNLEIQATRDKTTLNVVKEPLWIEKSIDWCVPFLEHSLVYKSNFLQFSDLLFDELGFLRTLYKEEKMHGVIKCLERLHKNYYCNFCNEDKKKNGVYEPSVVNLCFSCTVYQLIQNEWVKAWEFYELDKKQTKAVLSLSSVEALEKYCMKLIYGLTSNYHEVKRIDLKLRLTHTGNVTYFEDFQPLDSHVFYIDLQKLVLNLFQVWGSLSYQQILRGLKISDKPQAVCSEIQTLEKTGIIKRTAGLKIKDGRWELGELSNIDNLPMYKKEQVQILDQNRIRATQLRARELTAR
ncbi:MAG: hypothetical protein JGK17_24255 [Microcoleus sp. PH2017_10_PVI_O_A]|uniref:hypothetical protein n=1 Tax=unclassified Microcoleus TaxID=2642155 RepID=UPI001DB309B4|nr:MULTISPECIES: hypothetical protein [unclassified Microcoleus]TAE76863.1 MAG: hypothetical protein EAZ83_27475 [Oscillatoriales cyanobacterium]MCC3408634.1 hypothetical protein [Microcoleus sp. PH2017_10_PVI_O_A]MCC3462721.1 hypothetical protein [Microcoleus sp. PH2017_11_PCY_U_A]MCC3481172.1 hypothetical protein [Microcoleus sp. PH2017_12_PCY_D_A]MCC3531224.1 hypothetical protein [Microcoleus sp. PH2017_21_RUC_O_A]